MTLPVSVVRPVSTTPVVDAHAPRALVVALESRDPAALAATARWRRVRPGDSFVDIAAHSGAGALERTMRRTRPDVVVVVTGPGAQGLARLLHMLTGRARRPFVVWSAFGTDEDVMEDRKSTR